MERLITSIIVCLVAVAATAQVSTEKDTLRTNTETVAVILDGKNLKGGWSVLYGNEIDPLDTKAKDIVFASDIDTLKMTLDIMAIKGFYNCIRQWEKSTGKSDTYFREHL